MKILVTGGCGYIGSHATLALLKDGHDLTIIDNFCNSSQNMVGILENISNKKIPIVKGDLQNEDLVSSLFSNNKFEAVFHFAGLKSVSESVQHPLKYYLNNVVGTSNLLKEVQNHGVNKLIFSSSATIYSSKNPLPLKEDYPFATNTHAYGNSKIIIENMLRDISKANNNLSIAILRYFNPVGAHSSGIIGENPNNIPNNLVPYIVRVLEGKLPYLNIYGNDYDTPDGTGVRDYIHINDLIEGHLRAYKYLINNNGCHVWNLGSGKGHSVLEVKSLFEEIVSKDIPHRIVNRRDGDIAYSIADPSKANTELNWKTENDLKSMLFDAWKYSLKNNTQ